MTAKNEVTEIIKMMTKKMTDDEKLNFTKKAYKNAVELVTRDDASSSFNTEEFMNAINFASKHMSAIQKGMFVHKIYEEAIKISK